MTRIALIAALTASFPAFAGESLDVTVSDRAVPVLEISDTDTGARSIRASVQPGFEAHSARAAEILAQLAAEQDD